MAYTNKKDSKQLVHMCISAEANQNLQFSFIDSLEIIDYASMPKRE